MSHLNHARWALLTSLLPVGAALAASAAPVGDFTVSEIRVEGLQRISEGTVYTYLPINIGDHINADRVREAIRDLYKTGFFRDIELRRDGNTLVVAVLERPSLESIEVKGNKDIKTEDLQKSMRNVGLAAGKTFNRSTLEELTQYLIDQYHSRGKYAVTLDTKVEDLANNRVRVTVDIKEGDRAKIRRINLVGNKTFKSKDILETLKLKTPTWTSWYKQGDRYSREDLQSDLEKIQQYYQDRGYANYNTESVQVQISPDKKDIFINVNLNEGDVYKLGQVRIAGNTVVPEEQLKRLLLFSTGQVYSQKNITATQELIKNRLGAEGFFFAKVEPVPEIDEKKKIVNETLFVEPGSRVYVRKIGFTGTTRSNDETLRRELRQLEGALLSKPALERSKLKLQQQPYVEEVDYSTNQVPGSNDLVDVDFKIKERSSATIGGGIGYSASQKFMLNGYFNDSNFMGSGNNVALQIDSGRYQSIYSFAHTNPYVTVDGISRSVSVSLRDSSQFGATASDFRSRNAAIGLSYGFPLTEFQRLNAGISLQHVDQLAYAGASAQQAIDWVRGNGSTYTRDYVRTVVLPDGSTVSQSIVSYGTRFNPIELNLGWAFDSRNRALFADRGRRNTLSFAVAPAGSVRYWVGSYDFVGYVPMKRLTLQLSSTLAYGNTIGKGTGLSPFKRFYAGGPTSIRGFTEDTLGPVDNFGRPYGGNLLVTGSAELILPMPQKWQTSARVALFADIGNVFSTDGTKYLGADGQTAVDYKFGFNRMRQSAGIAMQWVAPALGVFRFSYAVPFKRVQNDGIHFGDQTENFQFTVGQSF